MLCYFIMMIQNENASVAMRCNQNTSFVKIYLHYVVLAKCKLCDAAEWKMQVLQWIVSKMQVLQCIVRKMQVLQCSKLRESTSSRATMAGWTSTNPSLGHTLFKLFKGTSRWAQRWQVINNHISWVDMFNPRISSSCHNKDLSNSACMMVLQVVL